jgi:chromosomal replication initiation ATPase DnaA
MNISVSKACGVTIDRLYSLTYERKGAHGRGIVAYLARGLAGQMVKEIAEHFWRSSMRISQSIIEVEKRLREDGSFRKMVEKLERDLIKQAKRKYFITIA